MRRFDLPHATLSQREPATRALMVVDQSREGGCWSREDGAVSAPLDPKQQTQQQHPRRNAGYLATSDSFPRPLQSGAGGINDGSR